jgi:hypothetical protein
MNINRKSRLGLHQGFLDGQWTGQQNSMNINRKSRLGLHQGGLDGQWTGQQQWAGQFRLLAFILLVLFAEKSFANKTQVGSNHKFNTIKKKNAIYANAQLQKFVENGVLDCSLRVERNGNKSLLVTSRGSYELSHTYTVEYIDETVAIVRLKLLYMNMMASDILIPFNASKQPLKPTWESSKGSGYEYQFIFDTSHQKILQNIKKAYPKAIFHNTTSVGPNEGTPAYETDAEHFPRFQLVLNIPPKRGVQFSQFCKF